MRVLQIIDQLGLGGAERITVDLTNELHAKKYFVKICVIDRIGPLFDRINDDIEVIVLDRNKSKWKRKLKLFRFLKEIRKADIIHVHGRNTYIYISELLNKYGVDKQLLFHDHSSDFDNIPQFLFDDLLKPSFYIGDSSRQLVWLNEIKAFGFKSFVLPIMVVKEKVDSKKNKKGAVMVGNIKPNKNQLFAIQLSAKLDIPLTIFGGIQDEEYYQTLLNEVDKLGVNDSVTFVHNEGNVQKRLKEFELGLHTSKAECGPLVTVEFLAQSLPFLSYKTGEVSEIIKSELSCFYVSNFDIDTWINQLQSVKNVNVNLEYVYNKHFSPTVYVNKCEEIYEEIIK